MGKNFAVLWQLFIGNVFSHWGIISNALPGSLTDLSAWMGLCTSNPLQGVALKSVSDPGNTFDLNPKWERTLPSFGNFSWNIYRVPQTQI
jgi:hypothetical protein